MAKYNINSKIQFGFEVNQPAYPKNVSGQLQLTNSLVDTITAQQKDSGGVIIWQMYSKQNTTANGTTSKYTMAQSCKTFLAGDSRYDCNANFPSAAK
jgi:chitinase